METYQYTAFISYRHASPDQDIATKLHTLIENYHIPDSIRKKMGKKKMGRVFRDQEELPLSQDLGTDIRKALDNSEWLIVIASPRYLQSQWCMAELDYFISIGKRDRILTLLVEGEPSESFPPQLLYQEKDGVMVEAEPLAGDVRADNVREALKKLNDEKLRILAPMLDVNFDELRQRARTRRIRIISAAAAACFALLSGFLIYAFRKNREITLQRNAAMDNQMALLIEQSSVSSTSGNKLLALQQLLEAGEVRKTVGEAHDSDFSAALEYALYCDPFDVILNIDNNNRQFDQLVFSNDGKYLLGITNLNSACLIDASTGKIIHTVSRSDVGQLDSVGFTKDNRYFYMVDSWYGFVSLFDVEDGKLYRQYDAGDDMAWSIAGTVFPMENEKILLFRDRTMVMWDYQNDKAEDILPVELCKVDSYTRPLIVALSPDEKNVAIGSHGGNVGMKIMSLDGSSSHDLEFDPQRGYYSMMYSGDGRFITAVSGNMYMVWNAETGKLVLRNYSYDEQFIDNVLINHDGSIVLTMSSNYLSAVDVASNTLLWEKTADSNIVTEALISPDGKYVSAAGGIQGIFDIRTGEQLYDGQMGAFSNDSRKVLSGIYGNEPVLLAMPSGATSSRVKQFSGSLYEVARYTEPADGKTIYINLSHNVGDIYKTADRQVGIYISPDLKYGAYSHQDGFIEVFDISDPDNAVNICCLAEHCYSMVTDLIFNGDLMASCGGYDPRCVLYDLKEGSIRYVLAGREYCHGCEFSPDGSKIIVICGYAVDRAYVYSTETGNLLYYFTAPEGRQITTAGFTEDGATVAAVFDDGSACIGLIYPDINRMLDEAGSR